MFGICCDSLVDDAAYLSGPWCRTIANIRPPETQLFRRYKRFWTTYVRYRGLKTLNEQTYFDEAIALLLSALTPVLNLSIIEGRLKRKLRATGMLLKAKRRLVLPEAGTNCQLCPIYAP